MRRRFAVAATSFVLAGVGSVAAVGALSDESVATDRTQEILKALGADQKTTPTLDLSGLTVRYVAQRNGDMVLVEGVEGTRGTVAVGCAERPAGAGAFICGTIRPEGTPAIAIGRAAPGVSSVVARFAGAATEVQVQSGLFLVRGPAVPAGSVRGSLPTSLAALDATGNELSVESAALGGG